MGGTTGHVLDRSESTHKSEILSKATPLISTQTKLAVLHGSCHHEAVGTSDGSRVIGSTDYLGDGVIAEGRHLSRNVHVILLKTDSELSRVIASPSVDSVVGRDCEDVITTCSDLFDDFVRQDDLLENLCIFLASDHLVRFFLFDRDLTVAVITSIEDLSFVGEGESTKGDTLHFGDLGRVVVDFSHRLLTRSIIRDREDLQ